MKTTKGFTLLELSIVLVILALLIGGVMVGKSLVSAAQIRHVVSETDRFKTAIRTFQTKYNCLPGDCDHASALFGGALNGNGDGRIGTLTTVGSADSVKAETPQAWFQLSQANLISGGSNGEDLGQQMVPGRNVPPSQLGDNIGYTLTYQEGGSVFDTSSWGGAGAYSGTSVLLLGQSGALNYETFEPAIPPTIAYGIDVKIDDGFPGSGNLTSKGYSSVFDGYGYDPGTSGSCSDSDVMQSARYVLTNKNNTCYLVFARIY